MFTETDDNHRNRGYIYLKRQIVTMVYIVYRDRRIRTPSYIIRIDKKLEI